MKITLSLFSFFILMSCSSLVVTDKIEFKTLAEMNYKRYGFGSASDGKNIYAVCGGISISPDFSNSIEKYDIENNKWSLLTDNIISRRYCNAEYIGSENKIYIFNGDYGNSNLHGFVKRVEIIDLNTNQVSFGSDNPFPVIHAGSDVWNNKIYFFGGEDSHGFSDRVLEYDPVTSVWKRLPDMPHAKHTSGKIVNGILYVFGGYDGHRSMLTNISAYNIADSNWIDLGNLPVAVSAHSTSSDGKRIWLIGCYEDLQFLAYFDTMTKEFKKFNSNMTDRRHAKAQIISNVLYVFGGNQNSFNSSALSNTQSADISMIK